MIDVLLGLQWGDEGKGKIVDYLASNYGIVARFQGGPNAGHTLYTQDKKIVLHQIPSGILHEHIVNLIGSGVVLCPITLQSELNQLQKLGYRPEKNLYISKRTSLIIPSHRLLDRASELSKGEQKIGSTLKGIGPAYMDVTGRNALKVGDIFDLHFREKYEYLKNKHSDLLDCMGCAKWIVEKAFKKEEDDFFAAIEALKTLEIVDAEYSLNESLQNGISVLAEGAQGSMLDVSFGTYPYVTSSHTTVGAVCTGLGVSPKTIRKVIGVSKAYCTRVGNGPFPTELQDEQGETMRRLGNEYGATTGRPRGCGWLDLVALRWACMINGVDELVITKIDILNDFDSVKICTEYVSADDKLITDFPFEINDDVIPLYEEFDSWGPFMKSSGIPVELEDFLIRIQSFTATPVTYVSNGSGRHDILLFNGAL